MESYLERNKHCHYKVTRWCCTSGNCSTCCDYGFGLHKRVRRIQLLTNDKQQAEKCFQNCKDYGPILFQQNAKGWEELKRNEYTY